MTEKRFTLRRPNIDYDIHCEEIADNGEWITYGDVVDLLNEQGEKIKELEQELFSERVGRFEDMLAEYGDLNDKKEWREQFGMSRREAHKKAGIIDWELIPED